MSDLLSRKFLKVLVSLGGNAVKSGKKTDTFKEQEANIQKTAAELSYIIKKNWQLIITHGNGPQVGDLLLKQEISKKKVCCQPLYVLDAQTQGEIGFLIQQSIDNFLKEEKIKRLITTIITRVLVDKKDKAFKNPTKPVGIFYDEEEAKRLSKKYNWVVKEDSGRGWRRVVPSPNPIDVAELDSIKNLIKNNVIVIAGGGGGIPVIKNGCGFCGVEAVIDKDKTSGLLAMELGVDLLIFLTSVEKVALNFGKKNQKDLEFLSLKDAKKYYHQGHFPAGSMGPKIEAAINFLSKSSSQERRVIITHPFKLYEALNGKTGTIISK